MYPKSFDRRHFLAASAAFASLHAIPAFPFQSPDPAAPRGRTRSLLAKACSPKKLAAALIPAANYRPFPTIVDRKSWDALPSSTRAALLSAGEACLNFKWPEMPATVFLQYARNGNRTNYQHLRDVRMKALQDLTFAECV